MPEQTPTPLGLALTWLRSAAALTQTRLAQALGLPKESISQYERGTKSLTREKLDFQMQAREYHERLTDIPMPEVMEKLGYEGQRHGEALVYRGHLIVVAMIIQNKMA